MSTPYMSPRPHIDLEAEAARLNKVMDEVGNVTIFLSEGAGLDAIIEEMEKDGQEVPRDPFGHVKLDKVNPGCLVRQTVRRQARCRKGHGPEVRLLLPVRQPRTKLTWSSSAAATDLACRLRPGR